MTRNGLLLFHQGWTDIVNSLALINIYAERYDRLYVLVRADAAPMINYYVRGLNVTPVFCDKRDMETQPIRHLVESAHIDVSGYEYIAHYDWLRPSTDPYKYAYWTLNQKNPSLTFERLFYESYDIPFSNRVDKFTLLRDTAAEDEVYKRVVKHEPYICIHTNPEVGTVNAPTDVETIELDKTSYIFFDMIRVLQNAKEIHMIDSVWAAVCYSIDARYGLLSHIPIYIYCHRGFRQMFTEPKTLPNWTIVNA